MSATDPILEREAESGQGCVRCKLQWPKARFTKVAAAIAAGEQNPEVVCDSCQARESTAEISEKVDEAQSIVSSGISRIVEVHGVESKANVIGYSYFSHHNGKELTLTNLTVWFKGKEETPAYLFSGVPVAVCEAWMVAPSKGKHFTEFIKNSYPFRKVKPGVLKSPSEKTDER